MAPFVCMLWPIQATSLAAKQLQFERELTSIPFWRTARAQPGLRIYERTDRPISIRHDDGGHLYLIGDLFDQKGENAPLRLSNDLSDNPIRGARGLLASQWGRYIAIWRRSDGQFSAALRDPCGAVDTSIWRRSELTIITNASPSVLLDWFRPEGGLNWTALHALAADPLFSSPTSPLAGATLIPSGSLVLEKGSGFETQPIWLPSAFAADPMPKTVDVEQHLRGTIDTCLGAYSRQPGAILAEVSGGFDSSVVAQGLHRERAAVGVWANHYTADPSGDERPFAKALGDYLDVPVTYRRRSAAKIDPVLIGETQFGLRPSVAGLDHAYESDTLALSASTGTKRLFSGLGGDGLFFSMPMVEIAGDLVRAHGVRSLFGTQSAELARWTRKSIWVIARTGFQRTNRMPALPHPPWIAPLRNDASTAHHPWLDDLASLSTAKKQHVVEQIMALVTLGSSLKGDAMDLVYPLFSQPVLELCLRIPVDRLVQGGCDRALARRAFQSQLPAAIVERQSKGELGHYYGRGVAEGLPALREFLLHGRLAAEGILNPDVLELVTQEAYLAQKGGFVPLLFTAAIEAWVRKWEGQMASAMR